jgi:hypothetical protein
MMTRRNLLMSLAEVLPELQSLSRVEKIRVIQFLAQELERDDSRNVEDLITPGVSYPIWSPESAYSAVAVLQQALQEHRGQT